MRENKRFEMEVIRKARELDKPFMWTFALPEYEYRPVRGFVNQDGKYIVHDVYAKDNRAYGIRITALARDVENPIRMLREAELFFDEIMVTGGIDEWERKQNSGAQKEQEDQPDPVQAGPVGESVGETEGTHEEVPNTESPIHDSGKQSSASSDEDSGRRPERGQGRKKARVEQRDTKSRSRGRAKRKSKAADND